MNPSDISRSMMDTADRMWFANRQSDDYLDLSVALPSDLLARVRAELFPKSDSEAIELAAIVALRVQFIFAADRVDFDRRNLFQRSIHKADLVILATKQGVKVTGYDTKADIIEKIYPRPTWNRFIESVRVEV